MPSSDEIKNLIEKFQETLKNWPRDGGLFLDLMSEKLKQIEQTFLREVTAQLPDDLLLKKKGTTQTNETGEKDVYIALYQMDGDNMDKWAMTLNAIAMQGISRPIYENEVDVCSMIRAKEQKTKEAYAVVKMKATDIINSAVSPKDRADRKLIYVKPGSLKTENISRFVHLSGQYLLQKGKLIKLDLSSPIRERPN